MYANLMYAINVCKFNIRNEYANMMYAIKLVREKYNCCVLYAIKQAECFDACKELDKDTLVLASTKSAVRRNKEQ